MSQTGTKFDFVNKYI